MKEQKMETRDMVIEEWINERVRNDECNSVWISGRIVQEAQFDHKSHDLKFYRFMLEVKRESSVSDVIPVIVSEKVTRIDDIQKDKYASVEGEIRTYKKRVNKQKTCNELNVFTRDIQIFDSEQELGNIANVNVVYLCGHLCKEPNYRITPMGRKITDLVTAINYGYCHKVSYIPCITWGSLAYMAGKMKVGDEVELQGRLQSRIYNKRISETEVEERTTYEVSTMRLLEVLLR